VEGEAGGVVGAVGELEGEDAAGVLPGFVGLPHIGVLVGRGVVGQAAVAGGHGLFDVIDRGAGAAERSGVIALRADD
jgi:hypothetical protein